MTAIAFPTAGPDGTATGGDLTVELVTGSRRPGHTTELEVLGTQTVALVADLEAPLEVDLVPSEEITPVATHYRCRTADWEWRIYVPSDGGPYNVGDPLLAVPDSVGLVYVRRRGTRWVAEFQLLDHGAPVDIAERPVTSLIKDAPGGELIATWTVEVLNGPLGKIRLVLEAVDSIDVPVGAYVFDVRVGDEVYGNGPDPVELVVVEAVS